MEGAPDHYATLGLDRGCAAAQIRAAYRLLAKRHHPDLHGEAPETVARAQALNAAHEILGDPARRRAYDRELAAAERLASPPAVASKIERHVRHDARVRLEDFLRGATIEVRLRDPANADGAECYALEIPPETAPGTRFRIPRASRGSGEVIVRLRPLPDRRFKVRGSDLRCDLRITAQRAEHGGTETIRTLAGTPRRIDIPPHTARGAILRIAGEGLPKPRSGRGDLLVRVIYRVEVRTRRM